MSLHVVLPREGHLDRHFHMFAHLKYKQNTTLVFDHMHPTINYEDFPVYDWTKFSGDVKEILPPNAPLARGKIFDMMCYVDVDLAGNKITRWSRTGLIIFLNQAPIYWFSNK